MEDFVSIIFDIKQIVCSVDAKVIYGVQVNALKDKDGGLTGKFKGKVHPDVKKALFDAGKCLK